MKSSQVFSWYGGKGAVGLHGWIVENLPRTSSTKIYCEPFLGSGSIFLSQEPYKIEILNDLDKEVVNFFRVCQDKTLFEEFHYKISFTPYALEEFKRALNILRTSKIGETPSVEHAWAFFVVQNQVISGLVYSGAHPSNWSKTFTCTRYMAKNVSKWHINMERLEWFAKRILSAQIFCMDAIECIKYCDSEKTLFYLDPPYMEETRSDTATSVYTHETSTTLHERLVETILNLKGSCALSGYDNSLYKELEKNGWIKISRKDKIRPRRRGNDCVEKEECLWIKYGKDGKKNFLF